MVTLEERTTTDPSPAFFFDFSAAFLTCADCLLAAASVLGTSNVLCLLALASLTSAVDSGAVLCLFTGNLAMDGTATGLAICRRWPLSRGHEDKRCPQKLLLFMLPQPLPVLMNVGLHNNSLHTDKHQDISSSAYGQHLIRNYFKKQTRENAARSDSESVCTQ